MAENASVFEEAKSTPSRDSFDLSGASFHDSSDIDVYPASVQMYQAPSMNVPDRIVLDGSFDSAAGKVDSRELSEDLKGNGVNFGDYMGGMVTPPRTLTVEDTALRFADKIAVKNALTSAQNDEVGDKNSGLFAENSQSEDTMFHLQTEIVQLNKRVTYLEHKLQEKQNNSYWKTTLVCLFTVINPLLIHWLFNRRRF